jgi:hypothetical protein
LQEKSTGTAKKNTTPAALSGDDGMRAGQMTPHSGCVIVARFDSSTRSRM